MYKIMYWVGANLFCHPVNIDLPILNPYIKAYIPHPNKTANFLISKKPKLENITGKIRSNAKILVLTYMLNEYLSIASFALKVILLKNKTRAFTKNNTGIISMIIKNNRQLTLIAKPSENKLIPLKIRIEVEIK